MILIHMQTHTTMMKTKRKKNNERNKDRRKAQHKSLAALMMICADELDMTGSDHVCRVKA